MPCENSCVAWLGEVHTPQRDVTTNWKFVVVDDFGEVHVVVGSLLNNEVKLSILFCRCCWCTKAKLIYT